MSRWDKWEPLPPVMAPEMVLDDSLSLSLFLTFSWAFSSYLIGLLSIPIFFRIHMFLFWPIANHVNFIKGQKLDFLIGSTVYLTYCIIALSQNDHITRPLLHCGFTSIKCFLEVYPKGWFLHLQKHTLRVCIFIYGCIQSASMYAYMLSNFISEAHLTGK